MNFVNRLSAGMMSMANFCKRFRYVCLKSANYMRPGNEDQQK